MTAGQRPVVLVHGFAGSNRRTWGPAGWFELLADEGRNPVGVELLGHGEGPHPHDPEAYQDLERLVAEQLPDGPCDAIGFSMGAKVLLKLAVDDPSRFDRLVLAGLGDNAFIADRDERLADLLEVDDLSGLPPGARYLVGQMRSGGSDPAALAACLRRPGHPPLTEAALASVVLPVLVVIGDQDFVGSPDRLVAALPDVRLLTLAGVDHFATPKHLGLLDATLDFLARAHPSPGSGSSPSGERGATNP